MNWWQHLSLGNKLNIFVITTIIVLISIMAFLFQGLIRDIMIRQVELRGSEIGSNIATLTADDIIQDNYYKTLENINKIKEKNEDVRYIIICDYAGQIILHTFNNDFPLGLSPNIDNSAVKNYSVTHFNSNEGSIYEINTPIENGNIGIVRVGMSNNIMYNMLSNTMSDFTSLAILICIIAVVIISFLTAYLIKPIKELAIIASEIKNNNYIVKSNYVGEDEIGKLAKSFNEMAQKLQENKEDNNRLLKALRLKEVNRNVLINKLFTAQEDERKAISRELHDGAGQSITSILAYLRVLSAKLTDDSQLKLVTAVREVIVNVLEELRQLAVNLRPPALDRFGVFTTIEKHLTSLAEHHNIEISFDYPKRKYLLSDNISLALYRILQEATTNILKHAHATSINISVDIGIENLILIISDNGCGFSKTTLANARDANHLGLYGMQERVELLNGSFEIESTIGQGTIIKISIPLKMEC